MDCTETNTRRGVAFFRDQVLIKNLTQFQRSTILDHYCEASLFQQPSNMKVDMISTMMMLLVIMMGSSSSNWQVSAAVTAGGNQQHGSSGVSTTPGGGETTPAAEIRQDVVDNKVSPIPGSVLYYYVLLSSSACSRSPAVESWPRFPCCLLMCLLVLTDQQSDGDRVPCSVLFLSTSERPPSPAAYYVRLVCGCC